MKTISIINLKGGVGKTVSAINVAYILAEVHKKRVLLIDNDKQGNTSKFFGVHDYDAPSITEVLTVKGYDPFNAIKEVWYWLDETGEKRESWLDVLPANMTLLKADKDILLDCSRPQQTRLSKAMERVSQYYDYCIIDNAPDLNMSVINALVATDDVMIPIKVDKFAFDGLEQILEQIEDIKEFNPRIKLRGCFVTMFQNCKVNRNGTQILQDAPDVPMFDTKIRRTVKVDESTFADKPLQAYAKNSTAARDYVALVKEYLEGV